MNMLDLQNLQGMLSFEPTPEERQRAMTQGLLMGGLGILGANAQNPRGAGPMGALSGAIPGLLAYNEILDRAPKQRLQNAQGLLQMNRLQKDMDNQGFLRDFVTKFGMGGTPVASGALGAEQAAGGAPGPTNAAAGRIPQAAANSIPPFEMLYAMGIDPKVVTGMRETHAMRMPDMQVSGNYAYDKRNVQPGFLPALNFSREGKGALSLPDPKTGLPVISPPQGALETFGAFEDVSKKADARYQLQTRPPLGPNQPPTYMSTLDALGMGGQPPQAPQPQAPRPQMTPQSFPRVTPQVQAQRDAEAAQIRAREQTGGGIPIQAVIPESRAAGMSPVQAAEVKGRESAESKTGQLQAESVNGYRERVPQLTSTLRRLDRLEQLTADDKTFAAAGAELKTQLGSIAQAVGLKINADKTANTEEYIAHVAELLKERLASKDYGSGTGVSNLDLLTAGRPLPEVMKTPQGRQQIIKALRMDTQRSIGDMNSAVEHFDKNLSLKGFQFPSSTQQQPAYGGQTAAPIRARNPKTGQEAELRNGQWVTIDRRAGASGRF
jgi:hypothetical protein